MLDESVHIKPGERIDDLQRASLRIIQNPETLCFGVDAVLLAHFARAKAGECVCDLGTGNGIVALLVCALYPVRHVHAVEIQPLLCDMAARSVAMNGLSSRITIHQIDLRSAADSLGHGTFDLVLSNPPYLPKDTGLLNPSNTLAVSRHEILCSLSDVATASAALLKNRGRTVLIHRAERTAEVLSTLSQARLEPKRIRYVHSEPGKDACLVLVEAVKLARPGVVVRPPLFLRDSDGKASTEMEQLYKGGTLLA
ncbi:MAG: tRNA1(Val) (adenine(37)-N6)-methyltransferase [Bacillota bacterium]